MTLQRELVTDVRLNSLDLGLVGHYSGFTLVDMSPVDLDFALVFLALGLGYFDFGFLALDLGLVRLARNL